MNLVDSRYILCRNFFCWIAKYSEAILTAAELIQVEDFQ